MDAGPWSGVVIDDDDEQGDDQTSARARGIPPLACLSGARGGRHREGPVAGAMGGADGTGERQSTCAWVCASVFLSTQCSGGLLGFGFWWGPIGRLSSFGGFCPLMWLVAVFNFRMSRGPNITLRLGGKPQSEAEKSRQ
jgi:hypothetical protein